MSRLKVQDNNTSWSANIKSIISMYLQTNVSKWNCGWQPLHRTFISILCHFKVSPLVIIHMCRLTHTIHSTKRDDLAHNTWYNTQIYKRRQRLFDTHHVQHYIVYSPCPDMSHLSMADHSHPFLLLLFFESFAAYLPLPSYISFTHARTSLTCCTEQSIAALTISKSKWVREIHFGFFLFSPRCSARQLLWWWDTKTALAADVHVSGKIIEFVCVCVCNV